MTNFSIGDYVWFTYETKEVYPGRIVDIKKDKYHVEICMSNKRNSEKDLDIVIGKKEQLKMRILGL